MNDHRTQAGSRFVLRSLGVLDLEAPDGTALASVLAQPKRLGLLAYLLFAPSRTFHRRDTLLTIFWPEVDQARARAALRQAVHFLRQALGADVLLSRGTEELGVARDRIRCDVDEFEAFLAKQDHEAATRLYHGPFLDGLHVTDTPEFERWIDRERERHARAYAEALESLVADARARGDLGRTIGYLRKLADHQPYQPATAVALMDALAAVGDLAGALAHARAYANRVTADLELAPDPTVLEFAERLRRAPPPSPILPEAEHRSVERPASGPSERVVESSRSTGFRLAMTVAVTLAVVTSLWAFAFRSSTTAAGEAPRGSIGIIPFESGADTTTEYIAHGLGRAIVRSLRDLRGLRVLGPEDTRGLVSDEGLEHRTAEQLEVAYLLRSAVTPSDTDRIRIASMLIRGASGDTVWRDTMRIGRRDLIRVHGRLATRVAVGMGVSLLPSERRLLSAPVTTDPDAYDQYLRGNQRLQNAVTRGDQLLAAVDLFERAVERDTSFALAYGQLAIAHLSLYWWQRDRTPERLAAAKAAADAVMRLRPDLPDAHLAMGWYHYWGRLDYDRALSHFEMARATRSPNSDLMILLAAMRRRQGDWEGSTTLYEDALHDNPTCAWCAMDLGYSQLVLGRYAEAAASLRQAVSLSPDFFYGQVFGGLLEIVWRGDTTRARSWLRLDSFDANEVIQLGTRHWAVLGRVLGPSYEAALERTRLTPAVDDTADYYLAKAQLLTRRRDRRQAGAYYDSAVTWLESRNAERSGDARTHALLGTAYAGQHRPTAAIAAGKRAIQLLPPSRDAMDGPLWMLRLAEIFVTLGRFDDAVDQLEQIVTMPSWVTPALLRVDPLWRPLWGHDRFERLASSP